MKRFVSTLCFVSLLLLGGILVSQEAYGQQNGSEVYLQPDSGLVNNKLRTGQEAFFTIYYVNGDPSYSVRIMSNGYELSASGGVTWSSTVTEAFTFNPFDQFDVVWDLCYFGWDGFGADTVGAVGVGSVDAGLPPAYNGPALTLSVEIDDNQAYDGQTFCIDSAFIPATPGWPWHYDVGIFVPTWGGPYCYEITYETTEVDCCSIDANIEGDIRIDVADLVYLIDYMFQDGPLPPSCR